MLFVPISVDFRAFRGNSLTVDWSESSRAINRIAYQQKGTLFLRVVIVQWRSAHLSTGHSGDQSAASVPLEVMLLRQELSPQTSRHEIQLSTSRCLRQTTDVWNSAFNNCRNSRL